MRFTLNLEEIVLLKFRGNLLNYFIIKHHKYRSTCQAWWNISVITVIWEPENHKFEVNFGSLVI